MDRPQSTPRPDRSHWPVRIYRLGEEPDDDLSASTTLTERLEMVWTLRDRSFSKDLADLAALGRGGRAE